MHTTTRLMSTAAIIVVSFISTVSAATVTDLSLGGGYQDNLFNDSAAIGDSYGSVAGDLQFFPSARTRISLNGAYNIFNSTPGLSNVIAGASFTVIPTDVASPVTISLSASGSYRDFGFEYDLYDQSGFAASAGAGVRLGPAVVLRARTGFASREYRHSSYGSNYGFDAACGVNLSLPGQNALAIDLEYAHRLWDLPAVDGATGDPGGGGSYGNTDPAVDRQPYNLAGGSVRYSRPLGARTGINASARYRAVFLDHAAAIPGYSIDYLSPWGDLWTGYGVSLGLKHFLPGQFILEFGGAYNDKSFVPTLESSAAPDSLTPETSVIPAREDQWAGLHFQLARPITLDSGALVTPTLSVGYVANESSVPGYDYTSFTATFVLGIRF